MNNTTFKLRNEGTVVVFTPMTDEAMELVHNILSIESWQWFGRSFVVDHRYAEDVCHVLDEYGAEFV